MSTSVVRPDLVTLLLLLGSRMGSEAKASAPGSRDERAQGDELPAEPVRVPGLFRKWEIPTLLEPGVSLSVEPVSQTDDGVALFAVFRGRRPESKEE